MINYAQLKTELQADPNNYGYSAPYAAGDNTACATLLNQVRATITIRRDNISPAEVLEVIDNRDFETTLNPGHVAWFESVTQLPLLRLINDDGTDTRILGNLRRILQNPGPQQSRARLADIANRQGSRAEQLFGANTLLTNEDIAKARLA